MVTVPSATDAGLGQMKHTGAGTTPTQKFSTSADMFGAVQARGAKKLGALITKEVNKEIRAEDERASMEVEQQIRDWSFETTQGEDGVYRKRGGGAIGSTKAVGENWTKFSSKLLQGKVVSAGGRRRIEAHISQKGDGIRNEVSRYERSQKAVYDNGLREARIQGAQEDAIYYSDDPEKITASLDMIKITHKRSASENGWSSDEAKQQLEDDISKLHMGVLEGLLDEKKGSQAAEYLEAYEDQIDGDDISKAKKAVSDGVVSQEASTVADTTMAKADADPDYTETKALAEIRVKYKNKVALKDAAVKRVKVRYGEKASAQTAQTKASQKSGWDKISKGNTPEDLTPDELAAAGRQVESMWAFAKNRSSRGKGFALSSETGVVQEWLGMTDAEIADEDLTPLQAKMTESDWNKISKRKNDAGRAIKELKDRPGQGATVERLLKEFAPTTWSVGLKAASKERRAQAQRARDGMNAYISNTIDKTGKLPTESDMRKESSRILMQIQDDGLLWFGEDTVVSERGDTPLSDLIMDDATLIQSTGVPKDSLEAVKAFIRSQGQPITINNMVKVWDSRESK